MADTLDSLASALQTFVVSPLNAFGLGGFVFDVQGEQIAHLSADITDHYTEDNRALQDHIAIRPSRITLKGYVGELVYSRAGNNNNSISQKVVQKLTTISAYLPQISAAATQAQQALSNPANSTLTLNSLANDIPAAANIYGLVKNVLGAVGNESKQQNAYNYFKALMTQGVLMAIQTPWEFLTNMAIESIVAVQNEESTFITDFSVTYKQIRIAATQTLAYVPAATGGTPSPGGISMQAPAAQQSVPVVNQGAVPGQDVGAPAGATSTWQYGATGTW